VIDLFMRMIVGQPGSVYVDVSMYVYMLCMLDVGDGKWAVEWLAVVGVTGVGGSIPSE
jgi:hypothetical protein